MEIKVLGPGCKRCQQTEDIVREVVAEAGLDATVQKVTDLMEIAMPAWVSFSTYLIEKYGMESFMELYKRSDAVTDEGDFNIIFRDIYGEDFPVVDRAWRLYVLRYEGDTAEKDTLQ